MSFEFKTDFDGTQAEVSEAEKKHVATVFSSYVDDKLLGNISDVFTPTYEGEASLILAVNDSEYGELTIGIEDDPQCLDFRKSISLQKIDEDGNGGDYIDYRLGEDGVVRRVDINKMSPEQRVLHRAAAEPLIHYDNPVRLAAQLALERDGLNEGRKNFELETKMGQNNQPIGILELERVIEIVEQGKVLR